MDQISALAALCAVAGHENVGLRHHLAQRLAHFRIGCANNRTNIAIFAAHALAAPFGNLFTDDFIQRSAVHQTILELTTAGVGSFYQHKNALIFFFADLYERIDAVGTQIRIHRCKILVKGCIALFSHYYFSEMGNRISLRSGTDIAAFYIADDNQTFLFAVCDGLLECDQTCYAELLIHGDLRLYCRNQIRYCIHDALIVLPDRFCSAL